MFPVKVGLVGLGRMARRLTEHAAKSPGDDGALQGLLKGADTWQVA